MVSECHFVCRFLPGEPDKNEGYYKPDQVGNKMESITDYRDGVGNYTTDELPSNEDERNDDDNDQFPEVVRVVFLGRRLVEFPLFVGPSLVV